MSNKKQKPNLFNLLQECVVEKNIEAKYHEIFKFYFPKAEINSPFRTDGILTDQQTGLKILIETKYSVDLNSQIERNKLIIQGIYYLKQLEGKGEELPTILFCGDKDECFYFHTNDLLPYLNMDLDWTINASIAPAKNPQLLTSNISNPFVEHINNDHFDFGIVVQKIIQLHQGVIQKVRITELNINRFFSYFRDRIIKQSNKYTPQELVSIFLNCLIDSSNNYPHPKKKNSLVTNVISKEVPINRNLYDSFFNHFETTYSVDEKKRLTAVCDRLIQDENRRFHGEFYTPTEWVLEAHKMIEQQFGPNWKDEYVVWDPAWGTGNLTRDFKFKELYCSTLHHSDLQIAQHYNPEAVKFQYDFLNDDVTSEGLLPVDKIKLPEGLLRAFEQNKPIIILMNPPFGTEANLRKQNKENIAKTTTYEIMKKNKYGKSTQDLYCQFLYRIINLKTIFPNSNIYITTFSPAAFLTLRGCSSFREKFLNVFNFEKGFVFNSKEFNISGNWPVLFSSWSSSKNTTDIFIFQIKEKKNYIIENKNKKIFYSLNKLEPAINWAKINSKKLKRVVTPKVSSPLTIVENGTNSSLQSIGFFACFGNNIEQGKFNNSIITAGYSNYGGFPIHSLDFEKVCALYSVRMLSSLTWYNRKDEYISPNEKHPEYLQWNNDCIIFSILSGQSSMRKITYKNKIWDIKNEWFWMSNEQMLQLANENGFDELYHDANGDHERFVFNKIQESTFSIDAAAVYNKACELVIKSFPYRIALHEEHPEWHLNCWDAGWYQIKLILKTFLPDDLKEFKVLYKAFEDRMREGVYKFGFLK